MASVPPRADTDHEPMTRDGSDAEPEVPRKRDREGSRRARTPVLLTVLAAAIVVALILVL